MEFQQFNQEFESFRGQLKSYILRICASVQDTEDIVQDTWIKASEKLHTFKGDSTLKTWVFTIASNLAKDNLNFRKRWTEDVTDICKAKAMSNPGYFQKSMQIRMTSPQGKFEIKEHIAFCFTCISKSLPMEQHVSLLLKEVYDFKVAEIAKIMNNTEAMIKYYLHTGRSKMVKIYDGKCALINKKGTCHQCSELNGIYNPKQDTQAELAKLEIVQAAESGDAKRAHLFELRMNVLKGIDPFESGAAELQLHHLEQNRKWMEEYLDKK